MVGWTINKPFRFFRSLYEKKFMNDFQWMKQKAYLCILSQQIKQIENKKELL